jgi:hypothetical protein
MFRLEHEDEDGRCEPANATGVDKGAFGRGVSAMALAKRSASGFLQIVWHSLRREQGANTSTHGSVFAKSRIPSQADEAAHA